jgi:recombination protein RecR
VVEQGSDVTGFEKAGIYSGLYFVLHGHLSPLKHVHPSDLGLELLLQRVKESTCEEVIFATSASIEGESTALYAAEQLRPLGVSLSRLAQGVPQGVGLECLDALTLGQAFCDRRAF